MKNSPNNEYLFSSLSENVRELNKHLLEVDWKNVDFNSDVFEEGITLRAPNLNDEQHRLLSIIVENIPEWERLLGCKQHHIHDYCLDVHTMSVLKKVKEQDAYEKQENYDKLILLYSALLHDIEKNGGELDPEHPMKGAKKSSSILFRLGFSEDFINTVYILINYHQVLGLLAAGKIDLSDEDLVMIFKTPRILELQAILSAADIKSVKKNEMFFNNNMDKKLEAVVGMIQKII